MLGYGTKDHFRELRGAMVGGTQYKAEDLEAHCPVSSWGCPRRSDNPYTSDKLTGRALGVTPKANGPPEAWANGGVLRRNIWGFTCRCMCLCVARGDQGTLLTVTGQAEHLILAAGGIHFVLISVSMGTFLSSKGVSIQTSQRRTGFVRTGNVYSAFPSWSHGPGAVAVLPLLRKWTWHLPAACACWKQREAFTDRR